MDRSKIVEIRSFSSLGEAAIHEALLRANGIECELLNETLSKLIPLTSDLLYIRLVVNEADVARAEEVLQAEYDMEEFNTESAKRRKKP